MCRREAGLPLSIEDKAAIMDAVYPPEPWHDPPAVAQT
jgi:hypothetical protein